MKQVLDLQNLVDTFFKELMGEGSPHGEKNSQTKKQYYL